MIHPTPTTLPGLGSATTLANVEDADGASLRVSAPAFGRAAARLAVPSYQPQTGDAVLVTRADDGSLYVVGVVRALREVEEVEKTDRVTASDGTVAQLETDAQGQEQLTLRDGTGRLLLSHHPDSGRTEIAASGDLALRAGGDLHLHAGGHVNVHAESDLQLEGRGDVCIASTDPDGNRGSALSMREGRTQLTAERLGASVERADVRVTELNVVSHTLRSVVARIKTEADRIETRTKQLLEYADESFRETEGLSQTRAGRLRLVAEKSVSLLADKARLIGREDVKIKGDKIYLA